MADIPLPGTYEAVRAASPDDSLIEEGLGFVQGMFRDLTTTKGLPLANWDKGTYDQVAGFLESRFLVPRDWFYDLNSYDSAELVGSVVSVLAVALCWKRADTENFTKLVGSIGVSAVISANPLLLVVMVVALAKAFQKARLEGRYGDFIDGQARGAVGSLGALVAASQVAVLGGPVGMSLLVGDRSRCTGKQGGVESKRRRSRPICGGSCEGSRESKSESCMHRPSRPTGPPPRAEGGKAAITLRYALLGDMSLCPLSHP